MPTRQAIDRLSKRINQLVSSRHHVTIVGCDEAECRESLARMRERGEIDDRAEIFCIFTGVPTAPMG